MAKKRADVQIIPTTPEHLVELAEKMREADRQEVIASSGRDILAVLEDSLKYSLAPLTAFINGELACVFGCVPFQLIGERAAPWMLGTDVVDKHPGELLRRCRQYTTGMNKAYPHLLNFVDARNHKSIRWLKWMGFTVHPAVPYGAEKRPFHLFEMRASSNV